LNTNMYRPFGFLLLLLQQSILSSAQVSIKDLVFESLTYDIGTIFDDQTGVTARYYFTNKGKNPFISSAIDVSCGCTNPHITKDTVLPGESAQIFAQFNPKGFLGKTSKWVYLRGNLTDAYQVELTFTANIKNQYTNNNKGEYYRGQYGYLLINRNSFTWGNQLNDAKFTDTLLIANDGYHDITIKKAQNKSGFFTFRDLPITISPDERKVMLVDVDLTKLDTVGPLGGMVKLYTDDRFIPNKELTYSINYVVDYSKLKKREVKKAPRIYMSTNAIEMGEMYSGTVRKKKLTITNNGKSNLKLQRIQSDCTCTLLNPRKKVLKPGESVQVEVKYDSLYKNGTQVKRIKIYSNDPINPLTTIFVYATVKSRG